MDKLDIHIENIVPGLTTMLALSLIWSFKLDLSFAGDTFLGFSLIAVAYTIGVLVHTLSRITMDTLSDYLTRGLMFKLFAGSKLEGLKSANRKQVNQIYFHYVKTAIDKGGDTAKEVAKRRQIARLMRSSLIPIIILHIYLMQQLCVVWYMASLIFIIELGSLLLLYGYAEVAILHESWHSMPDNLHSVKAIESYLEQQSNKAG